jgi:hypothetical protein
VAITDLDAVLTMDKAVVVKGLLNVVLCLLLLIISDTAEIEIVVDASHLFSVFLE